MVDIHSEEYIIGQNIRKYRKRKTSIAADAQAEANRKLAESLSDTLIDYQKIQKWDGKLPTVSGSNALVSIDPAE